MRFYASFLLLLCSADLTKSTTYIECFWLTKIIFKIQLPERNCTATKKREVFENEKNLAFKTNTQFIYFVSRWVMFVCLKVLVEDEEAAVSLVEGKHLSDYVQLNPPPKKKVCEFVSFSPIKFKKKKLCVGRKLWWKQKINGKNWHLKLMALNSIFHFKNALQMALV